MVCLSDYTLTQVQSFSESCLYQQMTFSPYVQFFSHLDSKIGERLLVFGAKDQNKPIGLVLAILNKKHKEAELLSIFTRPDYRGKGVASLLLERLQSALREQGIKVLKVFLERGLPQRNVLERLLLQHDFSSPKATHLMCRIYGPNKIFQAPWLQKNHTLNGFQSFLWSQITKEEKAAILEKQKKSPWFPKEMSPFRKEENIEAGSSIGVRYQDEVVGWVLARKILPDTIQYSSLFLKEDLQQSPLFSLMLMKAIQLHVFSENFWDCPNATIKIPIAWDELVRDIEGRMVPYFHQANEIVRLTKLLR